MTKVILEPFFLDTPNGRLFCLYRAPESAEACVLFVPPFAEEMNKCRRQFTVTSDALVDRGYATLIVDLYGTGDSEGEFVDATWQKWIDDVIAVLEWSKGTESPVDSLIATRLGCLLASEALCDSGYQLRKSVFWQPVHAGKQFINQFLRLRVAASMMSDSATETVGDLRDRLANNEIIEVAGYELSMALTAGIDGASPLAKLDSNLGKLRVFEIGTTPDSGLSPAGQRAVASATAQGLGASGDRIAGDPFWSATEIVVNTVLAQVSTDYLSRCVDSGP